MMKKIEEFIFYKKDISEIKDLISKNKSRIKGRIGILYAALHYEPHLKIELLDFLKSTGAPFDSESLSKVLFRLLDDVGEAGVNKQYISSSVMPVAEYLIEHGADVNWRNGLPLRVAVWTHSKDLVSMLVRSGADVNLSPDDGSTALMYACGNPDRVGNGGILWTNSDQKQEIAEFLINSGADVSAKNRRNRSAVTIAKSSDNYRVIELLKFFDKESALPVSLPAKNDGIEAINRLIKEELETQKHSVNSKTVIDMWPKDKKWLAARKETWKHAKSSIKELLGSNITTKDMVDLKQFYLAGKELKNTSCGGVLPLLFIWLHTSGDKEFFKRTFDISKSYLDSHNAYWTRYYLFTTGGAGKTTPYGRFGPRTELIVQTLYPFFYSHNTESNLSDKDKQIAGSFVKYFLSTSMAFLSKRDNDPFNPCQYMLDELINNAKILNTSGDVVLEERFAKIFLRSIDDFDPDQLPNYKKEAVLTFMKKFGPELESGELGKLIERSVSS